MKRALALTLSLASFVSFANDYVVISHDENGTQLISTTPTLTKAEAEVATVAPSGSFVDMVVTTPKNRMGVNIAEGEFIYSASSSTEAVDLTQQYESLFTNDPYNVQQYYLRSTQQHYIEKDGVYYGDYSGTGAMEAWELDVAADNDKVRVLVIDGGFYTNEDIEYSEGVNFIEADKATGAPSDPDFYDDNYAFTVTQTCDDGIDNHGLQVAGLIAATRDNSFGVAGAASNVELVAARALSCGTGYLSTVVRGVLYGANITDSTLVGEVPAITEQVDVINLSVAGAIVECPAILQEAINLATAKGITVISSAGNAETDASGYFPGNCANVINVGGANMANSAPWASSNTGVDVDIYAPAITPVVLSGPLDEVSTTEGTSNSAPLVAAAVAMIKRNVSSTSFEELEFLLKSTANIMPSGELSLDMPAALTNAIARNGESAGVISHAVEVGTSCNTETLINAFNQRYSLCEKARVTFMENIEQDAEREYQLVNAATDEVVMTTTLTTAFVDLADIDTEGTYTFNSCTNGECVTSPLNFDIDITIPSACAE